MSIHYKFRSAREYDTITVDGGFISLFDLKKAIIEAKKLGKSLDLDLEVVNAQTNEGKYSLNYLAFLELFLLILNQLTRTNQF